MKSIELEPSFIDGRIILSDELITLEVFNSEVDAQLAKTVLDSIGIFSAVFKDDAGGMEPQLQLMLGVKLKVRECDLEAAKEALG